MSQSQDSTNLEVLQAIKALTDSLDSRVENAYKKQRLLSTAPTFKREGNKQQYEHGEKVLSFLEATFQSIQSLDIDCAKSNLSDAIKTVQERQKLIRLADRSDLGWGVVKEYVADDLATDSSDEKRIKKAEKAAAAKKPTRKRPASSRFSPLAPRFPSRATSTSTLAAPQRQPPFRPYYYRSSAVDNRVCFQCGIHGHVRSNCPSLRVLQRQLGQGTKSVDAN